MSKIIIFIFTFLLFMPFSLKAQSNKIDKEISLTISKNELYGVLSKPKKNSQYPLAIIIAGSGPTDRNGNVPGLTNNSLKMLSTELLENNIATFRFDKRGVGKSQINNLKEQDLIFDDFVNDVKQWITYFKSDSSFSDIFLIGHSEGSLISFLTAQDIEISGVISLAGTAHPANIIIKEQLTNSVSEAILTEATSIIDSLSEQKKVTNIPYYFNTLFRESIQPYLINWFQYNPTIEIQKLDNPILIIHGTSDLQVAYTDADILEHNNTNTKKIIIQGMNHILKYVGDDLAKNQQSYNDPNLPISSKLINEVLLFIKENSRLKK